MADKKKSPAKKTTTEAENQEETQEAENQEETQEEDGNDGEEENRRINAIVTNRVKREMKGVLASLAAMQKTLETMSSKGKSEGDEDTDEETETAAAPKRAVEDPKTSKKLTKLERELAEERAERIKAQKERAEEHERNRRNEMRSQFQNALSEYGISDPLLMEAALDRLERSGQMIRDEDGKIKFKGQDKYGIETNFDPKTGLKSWVQTEGKSFVPAVDAGGSGAAPARVSGNSPSRGEFNKLSAAQKAAIEIDRASQGLPPLE